jgi:hypothetical protein
MIFGAERELLCAKGLTDWFWLDPTALNFWWIAGESTFPYPSARGIAKEES